jgi:fatty acid desaturase
MLITILGTIWVLIGVVLLGLYNALLIKDARIPDGTPENDKVSAEWHEVGAGLFLYLAFTAFFAFGAKFIPLSLSAFWAIFAGIVHKVGLNKPFFFVGTTAKTDKLLQKWFPNKAEKASAILKISMLVVSIALIILL